MKGTKRLLAFLLAFVMVLSTVTLSAVAEEDGGGEAGNPSPTNQTITINGEQHSTGSTIDYREGDKVRVDLYWKLEDEFHDTEFIYDLGDLVVDGQDQNHRGTIRKGDTPVGEYWTDEEHMLHINLYPDYAEEKDREINLWLEGVIQVNETELAEGEIGHFHIGDETLDLRVMYNESKVTLDKYSSSSYVTLNDEGEFEVKYTLTIMIDGTISELHIEDILGDGLYLPEKNGGDDSYKENFEFDFTLAHEMLDSQPDEESNAYNPHIDYTEDGDQNIFTLDFNGQFHNGDKITVTYTAYVTQDKIDNIVKEDNGDYSWNRDWMVANAAQGTYTNNKGDVGKTTGEPISVEVYFQFPELKKTGRWVDEGEFTTIEWTITFNPGSYGNLDNLINDTNYGLDYLWDYLGLSEFKDSLDNHQDLIEDGSNLNLEYLTLADFKWMGDHYELTYKTTVDGTQSKYSNKVESEFFDEMTLSDDATVEIGYVLDKEFVDKNADGTMSWSVDIEVPNETLSSWVLTDIPAILEKSDYNKTALEKGWRHRVILDSIRVVALDSNGQPEEGTAKLLSEIKATASYDSNNGSVVITFDVTNPFITDKQNSTSRSERMIRLTLDTEIVNPETLERIDEAFDESFYYVNNVNDELTKTKEEEKPIKRSDVAVCSDTVIPLIQKGIVGGEPDWNTGEQLTSSKSTEIQWYVDISKDFLHWDGTNDNGSLTGIVTDDPPFELVLEDTLPDYTEYVEGSAYVTLSDYGVHLQDSWQGRPDNIDDFNALLTKGLNVTDNGDGTITMRWELNDALARDILNFTLKSGAGAEPLEAKVGDGKKLDVFSSGGAIATSWSHTSLEIHYNTRVKSYEDFLKNMKPQGWSEKDGILFKNTVTGQINSVPIGSGHASVMIYKDEELGKKLTDYSLDEYTKLENDPDYGEYFRRYAVNANGIYNLFFCIEVNPQKFVFGTDDGMLHLTDQMKGLGLVLDSVRVTDMVTGEILDKSEYIVSADFKAKTVKFSVPDGRSFKIEYFTSIDANSIDEDGNISGISNEVSLDGNYGNPISTTIKPMKALLSNANATSANTIQLYKYYTAASGSMRGLSGAKFRIKPLKLEGETLVDADRNDMDNIIDPDAKGWWEYDETNGYFYMEGQSDPRVIFTNLHTDYIYYVWESQIPDGYTKGKDDNGKEIEGYYFVLNTYKGAEAGALYELRRTVGSKYDLAVIASGDPQYIHNEQAPATVTLSGTKAIEGRDWNPDLDDGKYRFKLTAVTGTSSVPMPSGEGSQPDGSYVVTNSGKNFYFPEFILSPGKYEYTISEVSPDDGDGGMIYSEDVYDVTVDVTADTATDKYSVKVTYSLNGQEVSAVIFTNTVKDSGGSGRSGGSALSVGLTEILRTGDDSMIALWLLIMAVSAIGIVAAFIRMRKRKDQQ